MPDRALALAHIQAATRNGPRTRRDLCRWAFQKESDVGQTVGGVGAVVINLIRISRPTAIVSRSRTQVEEALSILQRIT